MSSSPNTTPFTPPAQVLEHKWIHHDKLLPKQSEPYPTLLPNTHSTQILDRLSKPFPITPSPAATTPNSTSMWNLESHETQIKKFPASLFSEDELKMKRRLNLTRFDEFGNEYVYVRKS